MFSAYTALLYVNFHQSILYLSLDQRKSSLDFLLAILIGICFGLSMIFPLSSMFWVACLAVGVLLRKRALLTDFGKHVGRRIAEQAGIVVERGSGPGDEEAAWSRELKPIVQELRKLLPTSGHPVVKSWGPVSGFVWFAVALMGAIPLGLFASDVGLGWAYDPDQVALRVLLGFNVLYCITMLIFFLVRLVVATRIMPTQDERGEVALDNAFNEVCNNLKKVVPGGVS
jgi:hypothetical protein